MVEIHDAVPLTPVGGWTKDRIVFLGISGVLLVVLIFAVREVILPFVLAVIIAYVLTPLVAWGERRLHLPRALSIVLVYLLVLGTIVVSVSAVAPRIYDETVSFAREVPNMARGAARSHGPRFEKWINAYQGKNTLPEQRKQNSTGAFTLKKSGEDYRIELDSGFSVVQEAEGHWRVAPEKDPSSEIFRAYELVDQGVERFINYVQLNAIQFIKLGQSILAGLGRSVLLLFMTLMVAGYMMHTRESIVGFFRSLAPSNRRPGFDFLLRRLDRGLSGVVRGQLLICLVNGILTAIGLGILGLKYWPVLALLAGVMSIIPIFGSILSTVPAVFVGLTQDPWLALWAMVWIVGIHQVEANFLNPKIIGDAAHIHPVLVVFSLLVGEHFFGLWGALLGVPVLSITQSVFNHFRYSLPDAEVDSLAAAHLVPRLSMSRDMGR